MRAIYLDDLHGDFGVLDLKGCFGEGAQTRTRGARTPAGRQRAPPDEIRAGVARLRADFTISRACLRFLMWSKLPACFYLESQARKLAPLLHAATN
jgi:hypothetical protein